MRYLWHLLSFSQALSFRPEERNPMLEFSMFQRLPSWSQAEVLTKEGTLLAQRRHKDWTVSLYSLNNRFVELWTRDGLHITSSFHQDTTPLAIVEPYLEHVNVQDMLLS